MLLVAIYFIILQFMMMVAITLLFSTFSTPIFSAIFAFSLFVIGTFGNDLRNFAAMSHGATGGWPPPRLISCRILPRST